MQYVEVELDPNETAIAEAGSFMMMDDGVQMQTIFGDGSGQNQGVLGKLFSAGKRLLTGESLFMTAFTNMANGKKGCPLPPLILEKSFHWTFNNLMAGSFARKTHFSVQQKA